MNMIDLSYSLFYVTCGGILAYYCGREYGFLYGFLGAFLGFALGIVLLRTFFYVLSGWHLFFPLRPKCHNGCCKSNDYKFLHFEKTGCVFQCKCGIKYLKKSNTFMKMDPDGKTYPYMKKTPILGRWKPDKESGEDTANH